MEFKLAAITLALLVPLAALGSACEDDDSESGASGRGGSGGSAGAGGGGAGAGGAGGAGGQNDGGVTPDADAQADAASPDPRMSFFVSSDTNATGNLGGISGADARCQRLAAAVGLGGKTWRAYLSAEGNPIIDAGAIHARDRIGDGPWYNSRGALLANDLAALHARVGDAELFLDEHGNRVAGQWPGSPRPIEHDILTGTNSEGGVAAGFTCSDWTSEAADAAAMVGHSDGLGPDANANPPFSSWHSSHPSAGCHDTAPRGGSGRIYCFAQD